VLLAKGKPPIGLRQHTEDVLSVLTQLRAIWPEIPAGVEKAAIFHDLGKAASGFQRMLEGAGDPWKFRHEVLSAEIFRQCHDISGEDMFAAFLALLTHHKNLASGDKIAPAFQACYSLGPYSRWPEKWRELLANVAELKSEMAGLDSALDSWKPKDAQSPANEVGRLTREMPPVFARRDLAVARGALVAADHIASSGLRSVGLGQDISREALEVYARDHISDWTTWSGLQIQAGAQTGSAMLVAPTGAGKTEAALIWALANRRACERIFYVLPYQVSINAMATRIAQAFPDQQDHTDISSNTNVTILHSNMDLAYLQDAQSDELPREQALAVARSRTDAARKIYAPIKVTTVFQLLDIFFGRKFFEVGLLELTNSLVVFDEIHAYDGHTLGLIFVLLEYLQKLGARIFIMTATLPTALKSQLCHSAGIRPGSEMSLEEGDPLLGEVRRQIVVDDRCIQRAIEQMRESVRAGGKTAVVCNTVAKATEVFRLLADLKPLLVHSRFTLGQRAERETKENIGNYKLVIATQVIEVSLDVSFDCMFTELAPADSLLQRFGRVNRHGRCPDPNRPALCHVFCGDDAGSRRVYSPDLLEATRAHIPHDPLTFAAACNWIDAVYPVGLAREERIQMEAAEQTFRPLVAEIRPMIDSAVAKSLEETLLDSVQVIPIEMEARWAANKQERNHMEAKKLVVNVSMPSWKNALRKAGTETPREREGRTIAPFRYDVDQGLLLDSPLIK